MINYDHIVPIILLSTIVLLIVGDILLNIVDWTIALIDWFRRYWKQERDRALLRDLHRARVDPAPLFTFAYYAKSDDVDTGSSENPVLPLPSAVEPGSEPDRTSASSDDTTLHNESEGQLTTYEQQTNDAVKALALIKLPQIDGSSKYLTYETIAKIAGVSKQSAALLIREARGAPEPTPKPDKYSFERIDGTNQYKRIDK